jgi:ribose transport system substrate-binding protein
MHAKGRTSFHVGESCAFADGPAVFPISRGQLSRAEELGWRFTSLDASLSARRQATHLHQLIELHVDAITSFTLDPELAEPMYTHAAAAAIPIVTFGTESPSAVTTIRQRVDAEACAADAAAYISARVPNARVIVVGGPPIPALAGRARHFTEAAARARLEIVAREDNLGDVEEPARPIVARLLDRHPEADAIWCFNDYTALAAAKELRHRGRPIANDRQRGVIVNGIGGFPMLVDAIGEGWVTFTYDSNPVETGRTAIDAIETILVREQQPPREIWIDFACIDRSNVSSYVSWADR